MYLTIVLVHSERIEKAATGKYTVGDEDEAVSRIVMYIIIYWYHSIVKNLLIIAEGVKAKIWSNKDMHLIF